MPGSWGPETRNPHAHWGFRIEIRGIHTTSLVGAGVR